MCAAESTYTQTESQAWNQYLERLDELNSQLEHTREILEGAFQTARNNALRDWTEMETEAWDAYQRARTQVLQQPPEGQRQVGALSEGERQSRATAGRRATACCWAGSSAGSASRKPVHCRKGKRHVGLPQTNVQRVLLQSTVAASSVAQVMPPGGVSTRRISEAMQVSNS
jgi:hypothetical protein